MINKKSGEGTGLFLYNPCFLESLECAVLLNSAEGAGRDGENDSFLELGNVDTLLLEIGVTTNLTTGIELCCTGTVRISSSDD